MATTGTIQLRLAAKLADPLAVAIKAHNKANPKPKRMARLVRRRLRWEARRVLKRVGTCPRSKVRQLPPSLRGAWYYVRQQQPTQNDRWFMRTLGFLVLWGEFGGE